MRSRLRSGSLTAVLPCNDLDASERFYNRLGFARSHSEKPPPGERDSYRMLSNGKGGQLHLTDAVEGWLVPGKNPFGLYLYIEEIDVLAREFSGEIVGKSGPENKPWGMYEFALSDPDQTLVRVGWPTRLRVSSRKLPRQPAPRTAGGRRRPPQTSRAARTNSRSRKQETDEDQQSPPRLSRFSAPRRVT